MFEGLTPSNAFQKISWDDVSNFNFIGNGEETFHCQYEWIGEGKVKLVVNLEDRNVLPRKLFEEVLV